MTASLSIGGSPSFATERAWKRPILDIVPIVLVAGRVLARGSFRWSRAPMFCSECGVEANGKFCWSCGKPLAQGGAQSTKPGTDVVNGPPCDWTLLTDCQSLVAIPEIRERIARHAAKAKKSFSGEDFLAVCDKVFTPMSGGVPLTLIAKIAQPLAERFGFKSVKTRSEKMVERPGIMIVAILCSIAQNNHQIREATAEANGCTITAALPSDIWSLKADLVVSVRTEAQFTIVEACVTIPGQKYDWGKCNRVLDHLYDDLLQLTSAAA
jgi:hypothetical protein